MTLNQAQCLFLEQKKNGLNPLMVGFRVWDKDHYIEEKDNFNVVDMLTHQAECQRIGHEAAMANCTKSVSP